jgi:hypothetical protein
VNKAVPLSREYLLKRGTCCDNKCSNCPYRENEMNSIKRKELSLPTIAFSVTTCRRIHSFLKTMEEFMQFCIDPELIDGWFIMDDSSSVEDIKVMEERFPNFKIYHHENKNQAVSFNKILDLDYDYVFHIEDDWHFSTKFSIASILDDLAKNREIAQVSLVSYDSLQYYPYKDTDLSYYIFNIESKAVPQNYRDILENNINLYNELIHQSYPQKNNGSNNGLDFWWPGFVFGPSVINLNKLREYKFKVDENERPGIKEFTFACMLKAAGLATYVKDVGIYHNETQPSAFVLNENKRDWDSNLPTLVSSFIEIGRSETDNRSNEHYWSSLLELLKLPHPLVIYTEESNFKKILSNRNTNIQLIPCSTGNFKDYRDVDSVWFSKIQEIITNRDWLLQSSWIENSIISNKYYIILTLLKQEFLSKVSRFNYFNSTEFYWIDAGILNSFSTIDKRNLFQINNKKLNNFFMTTYPYRSATEVHGLDSSSMANLSGKATTYVTRASFFGGNIDAISGVDKVYYDIIKKLLSESKIGTEESIYTTLSYMYPELFMLYDMPNGDISNYFNRN